MKRDISVRDEWGIPHVRGDTADEVAYLQGYTAGTDRAWQMQVEKWRSEGRLAERLGAREVPWDRFARRARLDDTARRCFARLSPRTRHWIESYVDGVNAALDGARAPESRPPGARLIRGTRGRRSACSWSSTRSSARSPTSYGVLT